MAIQNQGAQKAGGGGGFQDPMAIHEVKDKVSNLANDVKALLSRPQVGEGTWDVITLSSNKIMFTPESFAVEL